MISAFLVDKGSGFSGFQAFLLKLLDEWGFDRYSRFLSRTGR